MEFDSHKNERLAAALDLIEQSASDERYDVYASEEGPLTVAELDPETRLSPIFKDVVDVYDWPSRMEDGTIESVYEYASPEDFIVALRGDGEPFLNNLNAIFRATRTDEFEINNLYGIKPPLHRAYAIAPDLFDGIRQLYELFPPVVGSSQLTELLRDQPVVSEQLFKAFRILGRLVKTTDLQTEMSIVTRQPAEDDILVSSAQDYLTT